MKNPFLMLAFCICLSLISYDSVAQRFSQDYWHNGEIDLTSGKTIKGKIRYDLEKNILEFQNNKGSYRTYNPRMVEAWQIKDALSGENKIFYSLNFTEEGFESDRPIFFELLTEGDQLILFTRRMVESRVENVYDPFWVGGRNISVTEECENYFLLDAFGKLFPCDDSLDKVIEVMQKKEEEVLEFLKRRRGRNDQREDLIALVNYYNNSQNQ